MTNEQAQNEVLWVESLAARDLRIRGIVAHASLEEGDGARGYLNWLAQRPLVKGVRRLLQGEADSRYCLQPSFLENIQLLGSLGLSFDICILHHQLPAVIEMVEQCQGVQFILDHGGKPDLKEADQAAWKRHLEHLAAYPNVSCKLSGLITEADHASWREEDIIPAMRHILACFGPDRVLFGSDWPVLLLAGDWKRWHAMVGAFVSDLPLAEQLAIMGGNATRIYRL